MKILIVAGEKLSEHDHLSCIFEVNQAKALITSGCDVTILAQHKFYSIFFLLKRERFNIIRVYEIIKNIPKIVEFNIGEINIIGVNVISISTRLMKRIRIARFIAKIGYSYYHTRHGSASIVHGHSRFLTGGLIAYQIKKRFNIPYVITDHSSVYYRRGVNKKELFQVRDVINESAEWLTVSNHLGSLIKRQIQGIDKRFTVIGNILPIMDNEDLSNRKDEKCGINLINIGSHDANKNQELLLSVFSRLKTEIDNLKLIMIGEGELSSYYKKIVSDLHIEKDVRFLGKQTHGQVLNHLLHADVLVHTSIYETFGVVIIEALACGIPVVSTRSGGPNSIIKDFNGVLVDNNEISLYLGIRKILDELHTFDKARIKEDVIGKYSSAVIAKELINVYLSKV